MDKESYDYANKILRRIELIRITEDNILENIKFYKTYEDYLCEDRILDSDLLKTFYEKMNMIFNEQKERLEQEFKNL